MNPIQNFSDKAAVSLSILCTAHCLILPLLLTSLPSTLALTMQDEVFHLSLVFLVVPMSLFALALGCKDHKRYRVLALGVAGMTCLLSAVFLDHHILGESGEKILTVIGSAFIALGHVFNYRLCRVKKLDACKC